MNHFVPDFDTDDDYLNVVNTNSSPSLNLPTKPITGQQDDLMELLWENGQVVLQNRRLNNTNDKPAQPLDQNLFIQEDEMTSWLHYPDLCSDLLFSSSAPNPPSAAAAARPPVPTIARTEIEPRPPVRNFMNFSRLRGDFSAPSISKAIVRESTQVNPSATPASAASDSGITRRTDGIDSRGSAVAGKGKAVAIEIPVTSSSVASMEAVNLEPVIVDDRKRKERDETHSQSEETKQGGGSTTSTTKRSRAAQVHNLSERKRRDRINERMKALQELIPRCNKSDKASMLDEAIEYMKSLQLQIQMMSMGCGVMPMMYPGMQQYMAMGMGMNPPPSFMPFPNMLPPQRPLPTQTPIAPHYPLRASDPTSSQPQFPGFFDPYQQFRNLHPTQPPQFQNQASSSRISSGKESEDQGNHTTG